MRLLLTLTIALLFSNLTSAQQYRLGLDFNDGGSSGLNAYESDAFGFGDELPDSTSLRDYAPYPGNQGNHGTCVGWSFGYCGLTTLYARQFGIKNRNVITAMAMCPYSIYNNIRSEYDSGCTTGTQLNDAGEFVTSKGSKRFYVHQSDCGTTDEVDESLMIFKADSYTSLWDWDTGGETDETEKVEKAKQALADGHIVLIGMGVGDSFCNGVNEEGEWIKSPLSWENEPSGGHAMCVIGYNDDKFGGTFEIQNSWGQDWGDGGYVYVRYDDFQEYVQCAGVMELDDDNKYTDMAKKKGCLFGDCNGKYSRFSFENGDTYEGLIKNGMPDGSGIYQWADGDLYAGEFKGGLKDGTGTYYYADGTTQHGHWKEDRYRADLAYLDYDFNTVDLGNAYFKGYTKGKTWLYGSYNLTYGMKIYEGKFSEDGNPHGFGLLVRYGENILGGFNEGAYEGLSAIFEDGAWTLYSCEGDDCDMAPETMLTKKFEELPDFDENKADSITDINDGNCAFGECENGFAQFQYKNGNSYRGYLMNGWRHGYGTYIFKEGNIQKFEGEYKNGLKNGLGKVTLMDGSWFLGEFTDGKADGMGLWKKADGTAQVGYWEEGEYIEEDEGFGFADNEPIELSTKAKSDMTTAKSKEPKIFTKPIVLK